MRTVFGIVGSAVALLAMVLFAMVPIFRAVLIVGVGITSLVGFGWLVATDIYDCLHAGRREGARGDIESDDPDWQVIQRQHTDQGDYKVVIDCSLNRKLISRGGSR